MEESKMNFSSRFYTGFGAIAVFIDKVITRLAIGSFLLMAISLLALLSIVAIRTGHGLGHTRMGLHLGSSMLIIMLIGFSISLMSAHLSSAPTKDHPGQALSRLYSCGQKHSSMKANDYVYPGNELSCLPVPFTAHYSASLPSNSHISLYPKWEWKRREYPLPDERPRRKLDAGRTRQINARPPSIS